MRLKFLLSLLAFGALAVVLLSPRPGPATAIGANSITSPDTAGTSSLDAQIVIKSAVDSETTNGLKDVASCAAAVSDPYTGTFTIANAYPNYWCTIQWGVLNTGTVPVNVSVGGFVVMGDPAGLAQYVKITSDCDSPTPQQLAVGESLQCVYIFSIIKGVSGSSPPEKAKLDLSSSIDICQAVPDQCGPGWSIKMVIDGTVSTGGVDAVWELPEIIGVPNPKCIDNEFSKDLALMTQEVKAAAKVLSVTLVNGYPNYLADCEVHLRYTGQIPGVVESITFDPKNLTGCVVDPPSMTGSFVATCNELVVRYVDGLCTQVQAGDLLAASLMVGVLNGAVPSTFYSFNVAVEVVQWDKSDCFGTAGTGALTQTLVINGAVNTGAGAPTPTITPTPTVTPTPTITPTSTKQPDPGDTDGDGCSDQRENGLDETQGGQRDYKNPWDFYDVDGLSGPDGYIDLLFDILGVIDHWQPTAGGAPPYDAAFDRGPSTGPNPWNMTAPDGVIDLLNDILGVIEQFSHDCR